jgi:hypothetical protein
VRIRQAALHGAAIRSPSRCGLVSSFFLTLLLLGMAWAPQADAVEHALPAPVLLERCRGFSDVKPGADAPLCEAYLRGYLAGAREAGWLSFRSDDQSQETFTERASRTRLGKWTPKPQGCIPDETTITALVEALVAYADTRVGLESLGAQQLVADMLLAVYPCRRGQT